MATTKKTPTKSAVKKAAKPAKVAVERSRYDLDATDKVLGRLATEAAALLRGKNKASYEHHIEAGNWVTITNAAKIKLSGKKIGQKEYFHYSGYPGGLKRRPLSNIMVTNPSVALKAAIWNMLPKNKLRDQMIKRLKITN